MFTSRPIRRSSTSLLTREGRLRSGKARTTGGESQKFPRQGSTDGAYVSTSFDSMIVTT